MAYKNPEPKLDEIVEEILEEKGNDYIKSEEVYFAFIDVLGFKKTFDDIRISQKEFETEKYRDVFNYFFELMNAARFMRRGSELGCYAGQTSESLYFCTERNAYLNQDFTLELDGFDKKKINTKTIVKNIKKNKRLFELM